MEQRRGKGGGGGGEEEGGWEKLRRGHTIKTVSTKIVQVSIFVF